MTGLKGCDANVCRVVSSAFGCHTCSKFVSSVKNGRRFAKSTLKLVVNFDSQHRPVTGLSTGPR